MKTAGLLLRVFLSAGIVLITVCPALAKDEWIQVRSKNFLLIGNASEKDIRKVGTKLEQFRETFRLLLKNTNLTSPIPTNVVVFKSNSSYKKFKPIRADGKVDEFIAGYFQPGADVNYITLSTEGEDARTYETIFHEYVHFIVETNFGKSRVPAWFNEGLAEYYSTFAIKDDQEIKLGLPEWSHRDLLRQNKLMPLEKLFGTSNYELHKAGTDSRNLFYAQSWALIHYLMEGKKSSDLGRFVALLSGNVPPEKAFQDAFQTDYKQMESELWKYINRGTLNYTIFKLEKKMEFDREMQVAPLSEAASNAYLGDLLYHLKRSDDAEPLLLNALKLDPSSSMANTTLGMVKMWQRKFDEARTYLEKAIAGDPKNVSAYYQYAYLLSREGGDEFGLVWGFEPATAAKIRAALRKAIAVNPAFTESYDLLAFVNLVTNEELDDALAQLMIALTYQPGNQRYALRAADVFRRQKKYQDAQAIAEKIARTAGDTEMKSRAEELLARISTEMDNEERRAAESKRLDSLRVADGVMLKRVESSKPLTEAEIVRQQEIAKLVAISQALYKGVDGAQRAVGSLQKIECKSKRVFFSIKTEKETFILASKDFDGLHLKAFDPDAVNLSLGCGAVLSAFKAVLTYKPAAVAADGVRGELVAIDFVPADFRLLTQDEMQGATYTIYPLREGRERSATAVAIGQTSPDTADPEARRHDAVMQAMRDTVRKPLDGEKRDIGFLERLECDEKDVFFHFRTANGSIKLLSASPESVKITFYAPDLGGLQVACGMKPVEYPAVFNYTDKANPKTKAAGVIISLEFMPKVFTLQ